MTAYSAEIDLALDLIAGAGGIGALIRQEAGSYDPLTDSEGSIVSRAIPVEAVVLPVSQRDIAVLPDTLVGKISRKALVAAKNLSMEPQPADKFTFAGHTYTVEQAGVLAPDGAPILYTLFVSG